MPALLKGVEKRNETGFLCFHLPQHAAVRVVKRKHVLLRRALSAANLRGHPVGDGFGLLRGVENHGLGQVTHRERGQRGEKDEPRVGLERGSKGTVAGL